MDSGLTWRLGHRPALDGLRGVAIALVVLAHVFREQLPTGGAVGVTVFFALSGFLITSLLIGDRANLGRVSFARFYERRARRLLPALVVYLLFWVALTVLDIGPYNLGVTETLGSLFYFSNWLMASFEPVSNPLGITWSLSIEEQFYLLWPLTFLAVRRYPQLPAIMASLGIVLAVALRVLAWDGSSAAAGQIYYRTDTRMDSLLMGCLLAWVVAHRGVSTRLHWAGLAGVAGLVVMVLVHDEQLKIVGGPFLTAAATCALIVAALAGGSRWLELPVLRWLGRRSYALYLWHYPLVALAWSGLLSMWLAVTLALLATEASWWLIERPTRRSRRRVVVGDSGGGEHGSVDRRFVDLAGVQVGHPRRAGE